MHGNIKRHGLAVCWSVSFYDSSQCGGIGDKNGKEYERYDCRRRAVRYCKWFSAGNQGSLLYRRNRRSAWRSDRFVDPAESNNRSANRKVDDLDQSSTDGGILDSVRTIKNSKTVKTVLICNAIIDLAVTPYLPVYTGNRFMACIIGGVLVGIGMAIVFMSGSTTGRK